MRKTQPSRAAISAAAFSDKLARAFPDHIAIAEETKKALETALVGRKLDDLHTSVHSSRGDYTEDLDAKLAVWLEDEKKLRDQYCLSPPQASAPL